MKTKTVKKVEKVVPKIEDDGDVYSVIFGIKTKDYKHNVLIALEIVSTEKIIEILKLDKKEWEQEFINTVTDGTVTGNWLFDRSGLKKYGLFYYVRIDDGYNMYRISGTENAKLYNYFGNGNDLKELLESEVK